MCNQVGHFGIVGIGLMQAVFDHSWLTHVVCFGSSLFFLVVVVVVCLARLVCLGLTSCAALTRPKFCQALFVNLNYIAIFSFYIYFAKFCPSLAYTLKLFNFIQEGGIGGGLGLR